MPPDLSARVGILEAKLSEVASDVKTLVKDVAEMKGKLSGMPTTFQIVTWFIGVAFALTALVFTIARTIK